LVKQAWDTQIDIKKRLYRDRKGRIELSPLELGKLRDYLSILRTHKRSVWPLRTREQTSAQQVVVLKGPQSR
jgi:hypothetical protein